MSDQLHHSHGHGHTHGAVDVGLILLSDGRATGRAPPRPPRRIAAALASINA